MFDLRKGAFTENNKEMIICVINYRQIPEFLKTVKKIPNTFLYYSDVVGVRGNFALNMEDETPTNGYCGELYSLF